HLEAHLGRERWIVEGGIELSEQNLTDLVAQWRHDLTCRHFAQLRSSRDERWPWQAIRFANTSISRALLNDTGGFDERFRFAHEDLELGLRLSKTGAKY